MTTIPALEIGGTHVTAALVDVGSWRLVSGTATTYALDAAWAAHEIVATVVDAARSLRPAEGSPWGVALPGPFDYAGGVAEYHGVGKFDALRGFDLGDALGRSLTREADEFHFLNDAQAFAVGEWVAGAATGHKRMIGVTLGTGVGSAFLVDGVGQSHGPGVPPEGRLDLLTIANQPLEDTVSRRAIRSRYAALTGDADTEPLDVREIAARARTGDLDARLSVGEAIYALGQVLGPRMLDFGASILVMGGSISRAWDIIEAELRAGMSETSRGSSNPFLISPAQLIEQAALVGAAQYAVRRQSETSRQARESSPATASEGNRASPSR